jgi:uncharacterized membrane protein
MKTLIRTLLMLALIVWLGAEIFFPVVAAVSFGQLASQPLGAHQAGMIVRALLSIVHGMGMVCGVVLLALLALAPAWGIFRARHVLAPMVLVVAMIAATAYSQFWIIRAMEKDRLAAPNGAIDSLPQNDPARVQFNALHQRSTQVEGAVVVLGILTVALVGFAEGGARLGRRQY